MANLVQQPYWADFKIKVGLYSYQVENEETNKILIDPTNIQFKFIYKDSKNNQLVVSYDGVTRVNHKIENNYIIVIVNSNTFKCGPLKVTRIFNTPDPDFNDGIWDYGNKTEYTNIEIVS